MQRLFLLRTALLVLGGGQSERIRLFGSPTLTLTDVMGSFTGVRLFSAGMTLSITGVVRFITGLMRLALTRDALRANVVEPAVRPDIGVLQLVRLRKRRSG